MVNPFQGLLGSKNKFRIIPTKRDIEKIEDFLWDELGCTKSRALTSSSRS
jgi:hypothetical protein